MSCRLQKRRDKFGSVTVLTNLWTRSLLQYYATIFLLSFLKKDVMMCMCNVHYYFVKKHFARIFQLLPQNKHGRWALFEKTSHSTIWQSDKQVLLYILRKLLLRRTNIYLYLFVLFFPKKFHFSMCFNLYVCSLSYWF